MKRGLVTMLVLIGVFIQVAFGISRLAFSRPGGMMRVPMTSIKRSPFLFSAGYVSEIVNVSPFNSFSGVYFDSELSRSFRLGFTSVATADTTADLQTSEYSPPLEIGFHLQQRVWLYGDVSFSVGLHDIVFTRTDKALSIDPDLLSFFGVLSSEKPVGKYHLSSYMGFGTGTLGSIPKSAKSTTTDGETPSQDEDKTTSSNISAGVFAGFLLKTPYFGEKGGMDLIGEFDGQGVNMGLRIPITSDYRIQIGVTHLENLPDFGTQGKVGLEQKGLSSDAPSVVFGLDLSIPRSLTAARARDVDGEIAGPRPTVTDKAFGAAFDSTLQTAEFVLATLRDSLRIAHFQIDNLQDQIALLEQRGIVLADSVRGMNLRVQMAKSNLNATMRHLSESLQDFYQDDYREALQEVEMAIQLNPDLAIAYARRGSIYFKLGDIQRATINWNLALKLDPEYDAVRNILRALHENRLKTTSLIQQ